MTPSQTGECDAGRARVLVGVRKHDQRVERKIDCVVRKPACEESCLQRQAHAHHARKDALLVARGSMASSLLLLAVSDGDSIMRCHLDRVAEVAPGRYFS